MPASAAYNGLTPVKTLTGDPIGTIREYRVPADTAAIGAGDLVTLTSGAATKIAVTPTPATASSLPIGVVVGVRYTTLPPLARRNCTANISLAVRPRLDIPISGSRSSTTRT